MKWISLHYSLRSSNSRPHRLRLDQMANSFLQVLRVTCLFIDLYTIYYHVFFFLVLAARSGMPTNRSSARRIEKLDSDDRDDQRLSRHISSNVLRSDEKNDYDGDVSDERPIRELADGGNC